MTTVLTLLSYWSLYKNINVSEDLITISMKDRITVEFEWRYNQYHTASVMGFLNASVNRHEYMELSKPSLDASVGSTSLGWFPKVYPEERDAFVENANRLYEDIGLDYNLTYSSDFGIVGPRPIDDQYMYPLLYSNPISLTYIGYDFYGPTSIGRPSSLIDLAMESREPVSTDKINLSLFGGPSNFVDDNLDPIQSEEAPVSFIIFHSVHDRKGNTYGAIGNAFEPRGFISDIASGFGDIVEDINVYVFRRINFVDGEYELLFDLNNYEEGNIFSTVTIDSVKETSKNYHVSTSESKIDRLEIVVVVTSSTKPDPITYCSVLVIGVLSTLLVWYVYNRIERTSEINKKLSKSKSKFIAEMSHELRTPLNGILGMNDILGFETLTSDGRQCLDDLKTCGTLLLGIISEVLDFSKIEAGKLQVDTRREDVREFSTKTLRIMKFYRAYHERESDLQLNLIVHEDVPREMISDFSKIGKILMNFVGNSIKFTEKGSITVTIQCDSRLPYDQGGKTKKGSQVIKKGVSVHEGEDMKYLKIVVRDTGSGMSSDSIQNLFQPFSQVQHGRSSDGGTGLGLVICRTFAESMGGCVKCESELNVGTTFSTWVQAKYFIQDSVYLHGNYEKQWTIEGSKNDKVVFSSNNSTSTVLIVDDVYINLRVMGKLLNTMDISYDVCSSGEEAIERCCHNAYDVVLIDYFMEGIDGVAAGNEIKKGELNRDCKIIILTANEYTDEIKDSGHGFLQKPITRDALKILKV